METEIEFWASASCICYTCMEKRKKRRKKQGIRPKDNNASSANLCVLNPSQLPCRKMEHAEEVEPPCNYSAICAISVPCHDLRTQRNHSRDRSC